MTQKSAAMFEPFPRPRRRRRSWANAALGGLILFAGFGLSCCAAVFSVPVAAGVLAVAFTIMVAGIVVRDVLFGGRA